MGVTIKIPTALRALTQNEAEVRVAAGTVGQALAALTAAYPDVGKHLYREDGTLRSFVSVYVNEDIIRQRDALNTGLTEGDTVLLVPSIAGGAPGGERCCARTDAG